MKRLLLVMLTVLALFQLACYKDKGNYDYSPVVAPTITNLDTLYNIAIGDTLVVKPTVTSTDPKARYSYTWRLGNPKKLWDTTLTGSTFKYVFNLDPDIYPVRLTITDSSNGMKYFRDFNVRGTTEFTAGTVVLSLVNNVTQLCFVKPDKTIMPDIYKALHGVDLPGKPTQVINLVKQQVSPVPTLGYWIICKGTDDGGVHLSTNTLLQYQTLRSDFFDQPAAARVGHVDGTENGVLRGVINGKLYEGAWQTYYYGDTYGFFGAPANGDYTLYDRVVGNVPLMLGYDTQHKQFAAFTNFGGPAYLGSNYQVTSTTAFDPKNISLDLQFLNLSSTVNCYAINKAADGTLYELGMQMMYMGFVQMTPLYYRPFPQPSLITANTKWAGTTTNGDIIYFTSGDKIYSYTPSNQQYFPLNLSLGGKTITMLKLINNDNTLVVGVDGSVYWYDITNGILGNLIKKIDGIPGSPIDVDERD
ncbi:hypothetical protein A4D02_23910 [Niastella koreensis]|uniref:PKD domain containing protein n=2 Tax=Niastella koreensis TaxID=354356 RepID=G8TC69_NIAKG|nr:PKD-like family lipoprotein [Niastella koreensis]AEW00376.1 hypothetical protein Niako_4097 [Niastella koreensis GR20-10]OQP52243.1 hypothetical protein A4D02_23910 [Niastella koreensis]